MVDEVVAEHLSEADTFALLLERDPMLRSTIVAIATFDRAPEWTRLCERIERATRLVPQFRMKLAASPLGLAPPRWVLDEDFELDWHVRRLRLAPTDGRDELLALARNWGMEAFDHDRPMWVFHLVEGLPEGRAALVMKVHHSLTDGIGGIQIAEHVVDLERDPPPPGPMPDVPPIEAPGPLDALLDPVAYHLARARELGHEVLEELPRAVARAATRPIGTLSDAAETARAVANFVRPVTSRRSPVMTGRSLRWHYSELDLPFDRLHDAAQVVSCTLNDAFLAGLAGGMRIYHQRHGAEVDRLRLTMPISVRRPGEPPGGNRVTLTRFDIPLTHTNAGVRMVQIDEKIREVRADPAIPFSNLIAGVLNLLPVSITGGMLKNVDFLASDVPGFRERVYVGGARLESFHAFGPTVGAAANITLMSYAEHCHLGVNTDARAVPDPFVFLQCLREGFEEVMALSDPAST